MHWQRAHNNVLTCASCALKPLQYDQFDSVANYTRKRLHTYKIVQTQINTFTHVHLTSHAHAHMYTRSHVHLCTSSNCQKKKKKNMNGLPHHKHVLQERLPL